MISDILLSVSIFIALMMALTGIVLAARAVFLPHGLAHVIVNGERVLDARLGDRLLAALEEAGIHLPTNCGGAGTCGWCRVTIARAREALPTERMTLSEADLARDVRLACQVIVRGDLAITVSADALMTEHWSCTVRRTRSVAPVIKEIVLALPDGQARTFRAGSFVRVTVPPFTLPFTEIAVDPRYESVWQHLGLRQLTASSTTKRARAYSLVNHPGETDALILNVRLAQPPAGRTDISPGVVSSYLFGLADGLTVDVSGPFGEFFIQDSDREIILVGGGVGMAPLRAHVFDQLEFRRTSRRISYWYGARSLIDLYYADDMARLAREHQNFSWHVALSDPSPEDAWKGEIGFIHDVLYRRYLQSHPHPEGCEYYLCGPPLMIEAARAVLHRLRVPPERVRHDDFGG